MSTTKSGAAVRIDTPAFQQALAKVVRVLPGKTVLPVLSHVLVEVFNGEAELDNPHDPFLRLTATSLDTWIRVEVPCEAGDREMSWLAPGKQLADVVAKLSGESVALDAGKGGSLLLRAGGSRVEMRCMDVAEAPVFPVVSGDTFRMDAKHFVLAAQRAAPVVSDMANPSNGAKRYVEMRMDDGALSISGTDGIQGGTTVCEWAGGARQSVLFRPADLMNAARVFADAGEVEMGCGAEWLSLATTDGSVRMLCRSVAEKYPDLSGILLSQRKLVSETLHVDRYELLGAVERLLAAGDGAETTKVRFRLFEDAVRLDTFSPDSGNANETVRAEGCALGSAPPIFGLRASNLAAAIRRLSGSRLRIEACSGDRAPVFLFDAEDESYTQFFARYTVNEVNWPLPEEEER